MVDKFNEFPSLKELLAAAAAGHERAIDELRARYDRVVCSCILSQFKRQGCYDHVGHGKELIGLAWFKIIMHGNQLKDEERVEGWMSKIISNLASEHVSGPKGCITLQKRTTQLEPRQDAQIVPAHKLIQRTVLVNELIKRAYEWSPMFGKILELHFMEGRTLEEVAEEFDQSFTKVRSFYYRNLHEFRKLFKDDSEDDGGDDSDDGDSQYEN
jgi:DNA-directed RNA polymerase specialized sigma24 family protein